MALNPSASYPLQTVAGSPTMPYGAARDVITDDDGSGTPLHEDWVNDLWGFEQALLRESNVTPSGVPDNAQTSQYVVALKRMVYGAIAVSQHANFTTQDTVSGVYHSVAYGNDKWIAVGNPGLIKTSYDGFSWSAQSFAVSYAGAAHGVVWTGSAWVACGTGAMLQTSAGGTTWTAQTAAASFAGDFFSICSNGTTTVVVGSSCEIQTANALGAPWTRRTAPWSDSNAFSEVICAPWGTFFVCGGGGRIASSPDGVTWTARLNGGLGTNAFASIAAATINGQNVVVAVASSGGVIARSTDGGLTWSGVTPPAGATAWNHVAWNGTCFVASGAASPSSGVFPIYLSVDGLSWVGVYISVSGQIRATYRQRDQGVTVAVGSVGLSAYIGRSLTAPKLWPAPWE